MFFFFLHNVTARGRGWFKERQLMELAIINGTYRDTKSQQSPSGTPTATATALPLRRLLVSWSPLFTRWSEYSTLWHAACWIFCTNVFTFFVSFVWFLLWRHLSPHLFRFHLFGVPSLFINLSQNPIASLFILSHNLPRLYVVEIVSVELHVSL